ncbi:hypothetical protein ACFP81_14215 [Deinococcus lacus]|uniref:Uncharacterized protein n=1 Tax=Deinococcus lacus TaxID=392561 RepID=A0ABW1YG17_9DEIO
MSRWSAGLAWLVLGLGTAQAADYATPAETLRARLAEAGLESSFDPASAAQLVAEAEAAYREVQGPLEQAAPVEAQAVSGALAQARAAAQAGDETRLAQARGAAWTALLRGPGKPRKAQLKAGTRQPPVTGLPCASSARPAA